MSSGVSVQKSGASEVEGKQAGAGVSAGFAQWAITGKNGKLSWDEFTEEEAKLNPTPAPTSGPQPSSTASVGKSWAKSVGTTAPQSSGDGWNTVTGKKAQRRPGPARAASSRTAGAPKAPPCFFAKSHGCKNTAEPQGPLAVRWWPYCSDCYKTRKGKKCKTDGCDELCSLRTKVPGAYHPVCETCRLSQA